MKKKLVTLLLSACLVLPGGVTANAAALSDSPDVISVETNLKAESGDLVYQDFEYCINAQTGTVILTGYTGKGGEVSIPATIDGKTVSTIGEDAFTGCKTITSVTIPAGVTSISEGAFGKCTALTSVTLPESLKSIGESAFEGCSVLVSITIPKNVESIAMRAFSGCTELTSITVDENNAIYDSRDNCNAIIEKSANTLIAG